MGLPLSFDLIVQTGGGIDWGTVGSCVSAVATVMLTWVAWREVPKLRRAIDDSQHLTTELADLMALHCEEPETTVLLPASGDGDYVICDLRTGRHSPVFERVVVEFAGRHTPPFTASYVDESILDGMDISGRLAFKIAIAQGRLPTSGESPPVARLDGQQVVDAVVAHGDGDMSCVVGVRRRTPFSVISLSDPPRIVVDFKYG